MKIERINDNQIRCTLTSLDLSSRGINLAELAYGSEKARNLFREMIQQAAKEVGFEAEDIPLMVEAIPLSSESIMLIVTKVEDPEELDTRFSKFSPFAEAESEIFFPSWPMNFWKVPVTWQNFWDKVDLIPLSLIWIPLLKMQKLKNQRFLRSSCAPSVLTAWIRSAKLHGQPEAAAMRSIMPCIKSLPPVSIIWY